MMRLPLLALIATASMLGLNTAYAANANQGNAARGKSLIYTCAGCHGIPGYENAYPNYRVPRIAGQRKQYILNALHEYRSGNRQHPTMHAQATSLTEQNILDIATYLSSLAKPHVKEPANIKVPAKAVACTACHGKYGQGNPAMPEAPRLAGQYQNYMEQALLEYQTGQRGNPIMKGIAGPLSKRDIREVTAYFSSLPSELSTLKYHIQGSNIMGASN